MFTVISDKLSYSLLYITFHSTGLTTKKKPFHSACYPNFGFFKLYYLYIILRSLLFEKDLGRWKDFVFATSPLKVICKSVVDKLKPRTGSSSMLGLFFNQIWSLMQKLHVSIHHVNHFINLPPHILAALQEFTNLPIVLYVITHSYCDVYLFLTFNINNEYTNIAKCL